MDAEITPAGLKIDGTLISAGSDVLNNLFGNNYREIEIPLHGGGIRRIRLFDQLGFAYYLDETPPEVPCVLFALSTSDVPFEMRHAFQGSLQINKTRVNADMSAATLPIAGELRFEPQVWEQMASYRERILGLVFTSSKKKPRWKAQRQAEIERRFNLF